MKDNRKIYALDVEFLLDGAHSELDRFTSEMTTARDGAEIINPPDLIVQFKLGALWMLSHFSYAIRELVEGCENERDTD